MSSSGGVQAPCHYQLENHRSNSGLTVDLLIVIAAGDPFTFHNTNTLRWLNALSRRGIPIGGVSGGPVILALAGIMAGYRMTLHWEHAAALRLRHADLLIERSLYVIDRDRLTCAGGTAPLDLMHAILMRQQGAALARDVSDWLQHTDVRPAGGQQRAGIVERYQIHQGSLLTSIELMESHLADPLDLKSLARIAGVGERQLTRLFNEHLGSSPMAFYQGLRLQRAQVLLRQSALGVTEIAHAVGFTNAAHFTTRYRAHFGLAPREERKTKPGNEHQV